MTNQEARDILTDFKTHFLKGLSGTYYDKLVEAIEQLYDASRLYDLDLEASAVE